MDPGYQRVRRGRNDRTCLDQLVLWVSPAIPYAGKCKDRIIDSVSEVSLEAQCNSRGLVRFSQDD